jgi:hypothetical protein
LHFDSNILLNDLARLRAADRTFAVFGAETHSYQLHRPLTVEAVLAFEGDLEIALPEDYRQFLTEIGNGRAGPYYGVFGLGEMDAGWSYKFWKEMVDVGDVSRPFPHTGPWNDLTGQPDCERDGTEESDRLWDAFERHYYNPANFNGAIPICHVGCAYRQWLVVTGAEAGHVWCDDIADYGGLYPLSEKGFTRVTFCQWYRNWLDEALAKFA